MNSRSSHFARTVWLTCAAAITGTSVCTARQVALPSAPEELSTWHSAGESFSRNSTAPSAAVTGSWRATARISDSASLMRSMANLEPRQPNAARRRRPRNAQVIAGPFGFALVPIVQCLDLVAENGNDVLSISQEPHDTEMDVRLKVGPLHRKARHAPRSQ